jgi:hypothetical protein
MTRSHCRKLVVPLIAIAYASLSGIAAADEATGKVVWIDEKNFSLLLECPDKGCPQIPNAKTGETYTFVIPAAMRKNVMALKEGQMVTIVYDDGKDKGYVITAVNAK